MKQDKQENDLITNNDRKIFDDEIDLTNLISSLYKRKKILAFFSMGGLLIGLIYGQISKSIWRGEFQIVIGNKTNNSRNTNNLTAESLLLSGIGIEPKNQLKTEVTILESSSVLMDTFKFVKEYKLKNGNVSFRNKRFQDWKNKSLEAGLEKGTSVLNISYQDQDKNLVLPVLNKISETYQDYSGKNRKRNIELGIKYFEEQIKIYKNKSKLSSYKANEFGLKNALTPISIKSSSPLNNKGIPSIIDLKVNVEELKIRSKNNIKILKEQLFQIQQTGDNPEEILGFLSTIDGIDKQLGFELQELNSQIAIKSTFYKKDAKPLQNLYDQRKSFIKTIKKQMEGFYSAQIEKEEALLKSSFREEGVVLKYKELVKEANKDSSVLSGLENEYQLVLLEKARNQDPWELITKPTLLPEPVAPNKLLFTLIGFFSGIFLGCFSILFYNRSKNFIENTDTIRKFFEWDIITSLPINDKKEFDEIIELITKNLLSSIDVGLSILVVGEINESILIDLNNAFQKNLPKLKIVTTSNILEAIKLPNLIIFSVLGVTRIDELKKMNKNLKLQKKKILGMIVANDKI